LEHCARERRAGALSGCTERGSTALVRSVARWRRR
jgi:hypothetical protein